ncbi:hypothetical protein L596_015573 [Steinernema carpocapsae]|uniref:Uncharacterized protein n=1 Tax=Steinernema carpocapsae TaxID=34508 RepID=A0A4U5NFD0_STECR|nr:hypothetical protein L596_015573 [Steinernema carpocapsae]
MIAEAFSLSQPFFNITVFTNSVHTNPSLRHASVTKITPNPLPTAAAPRHHFENCGELFSEVRSATGRHSMLSRTLTHLNPSPLLPMESLSSPLLPPPLPPKTAPTDYSVFRDRSLKLIALSS